MPGASIEASNRFMVTVAVAAVLFGGIDKVETAWVCELSTKMTAALKRWMDDNRDFCQQLKDSVPLPSAVPVEGE